MGQGASAHLGVGPQLLKAAKAGDAELVTRLVSTLPGLLRYSSFHQLSAVHLAVRGDHVDVLRLLFAKAAELEHHAGREAAAAAPAGGSAAGRHADAARPLGLARRRRQQPPPPRARARKSLAAQMANAATDRGVTPLMLAAANGCVENVTLLLANGADPWATDRLGGRNALHYATRSNSFEIMQQLVEAAGATGPVQFPNRPNTKYVDVRTQTGFTAVHYAVQAGSTLALQVLLRHGANPLLSSLFDSLDDINCVRGTTPLHLSARLGNDAAAKQLLKAYLEQWYSRNLPDPRLLMDGDMHLPCQVAARREHEELAHMLLPSTPLEGMFAEGELQTFGPPTLAAIAGKVLRSTLLGDLQPMLQAEAQQQQQHDAAHAVLPALLRRAASCASADGSDSDGVSTSSLSSSFVPLAAVRFASQRPASLDELCDAAAAGVAALASGGRRFPRRARGHSAQQQQAEEEEASQPAAPRALPVAAAQRELDEEAAALPAVVAEPVVAEPAGTQDASGDALCGVCLDAAPQVALAPCSHELCVGCCQRLLALNSRCVMVCPFCRASVARLLPLAASMGSQPATPVVAPRQRHAAAAPVALPALVA